MASWIFGSTTLPDAEAPWYDSAMPENQENEHVTATPIGATGTASTIVQAVNKPSMVATLQGECSSSTKAALLALVATTFTLKTPFDATGKSWYMLKARFDRWNNSDHRHAIAGASERFLYRVELIGR